MRNIDRIPNCETSGIWFIKNIKPTKVHQVKNNKVKKLENIFGYRKDESNNTVKNGQWT
jgi:hypothetical protein